MRHSFPMNIRDADHTKYLSLESDNQVVTCACASVELAVVWQRAQYSQSERGLEFFVQLRREDRITVMNQELVQTVIRKGFPKLLQRPVCRRMRGHVVVENARAANLHY